MANAIASSSQAVKRSSPNTTGPSSAKRARQSSTKHDDFDDDEDIDEDGAELDQSAKAKAERKAARIIRNRESAQRSRNQRKQHLAWLESRVIELERENRALRSGDTPSLSSSSSARESSPSQSVASFASDLGIPPEVVNSSGGVNLANVAPPPSDLDVKPVVEQCLNTVEAVQTSDLEMENAALRERVSLLENLVKQVVALSNLGSVPSATSQSSLATPTTSANPAMDWEALNHLTVPSTQSGGVTLSPAMYHATPLTATSDDSMTNPTVSLFENESVHGQKSGLDLTCHPAAMVTSSLAEAALQRVRTPSVSVSLEMNSARLRTVARVVVALAKVKGLTKPTSPWNRQDHTRRSRWMSRCGARDQWAKKTGMRG